MILYVNGDSHSLGVMPHDASRKSFVDILSEYFNLDVVNQACAAASADSVVRKTEHFVSTVTPNLVLIGWGAWDREEWLHDGKYYNAMEHWNKHLPDELQSKYQIWVNNLGPEYLNSNSKKAHTKIFDLHQSLSVKKIPHLFFNCMYNFFEISDTEKKDWNNCYIGPYDNNSSYYWYLTGGKFISDKWYHFGPEGHKAWADVLIKYIKENKIL